MPDKDQTTISISYDGRLAATGHMHLYELSRSQYAFARILALVEHFRRTGQVVDRVTGSANVETIVGVPKEGSFAIDVLIKGAQEIAGVAISVPFEAIISYLWESIFSTLPRNESELIELARIHAAELDDMKEVGIEQQKTIQIALSVIEQQNATTQQALTLIKWAQGSDNAAIRRADINSQLLSQMESDFLDQEKRQEIIDQYEDELSKIDPNKVEEIASKIRGNMYEFSLPLRRSAEVIRFSDHANDNLVHIDSQRAKQIWQRETSEDVEEFMGRVEGYFRNTGVGKISSDRFSKLITFVVPTRYRKEMLEPILSAMNTDEVRIWARTVSDGSGQPTSLILEALEHLEGEEDDDFEGD